MAYEIKYQYYKTGITPRASAREGILMKRDSSWIYLMGFFCLLAVFMIYYGVSQIVKAASFKAKASVATGEVVRNEERLLRAARYIYHPIVKYTPEGGTEFEFKGHTGSNPPEHKVGDTVRVIYNPQNPSEAMIDSFLDLYRTPLIPAGLGALLLLIFLGLPLMGYREKKYNAWMAANAKRVTGRVTAITVDTSIKVNGRSPWIIAVEFNDYKTGEMRTAKSYPLWTDPAPYINGGEITVLVDPRNTKKHKLDLSFLPNAG